MTSIICDQCKGQFPFTKDIFCDIQVKGQRDVIDRFIRCPQCGYQSHSCYTSHALLRDAARVSRLNRAARAAGTKAARAAYERAKHKYQLAFNRFQARMLKANINRSGEPPLQIIPGASE